MSGYRKKHRKSINTFSRVKENYFGERYLTIQEFVNISYQKRRKWVGFLDAIAYV